MFIEQNHGLDGAQGQQVEERFLPFEGLPVHGEVYHLITLIYPRHVLDVLNHCFWFILLFIPPMGVLQPRLVHRGQHEDVTDMYTGHT